MKKEQVKRYIKNLLLYSGIRQPKNKEEVFALQTIIKNERASVKRKIGDVLPDVREAVETNQGKSKRDLARQIYRVRISGSNENAKKIKSSLKHANKTVDDLDQDIWTKLALAEQQKGLAHLKKEERLKALVEYIQKAYNNPEWNRVNAHVATLEAEHNGCIAGSRSLTVKKTIKEINEYLIYQKKIDKLDKKSAELFRRLRQLQGKHGRFQDSASPKKTK